ncbi:MAG: DUF58 domain-containing protein [Bacillota bacterium]
MDKNDLNLFVIILLALGIIALLAQIYVVFFLTIFICLFIFFLRYWTEHIFDKLTVERNFTREKVFSGQKFYLEIVISNKKLMPIIWLKLRSRISYEISFENPRYCSDIIGKRKVYQDLFSIKSYQTVKRKYALRVEKRGVMSSYMHVITYTDPLGFTKEYIDNEGISLIVYPRVLPLSAPLVDFALLFGSKPEAGWIFQDKLNRTGVRPYSSSDSFRQINWKASARSLELKSDIYKPSFDREVFIFHGLSKEYKIKDKATINNVELSIITAASLAEKYFQAGFTLSFYSNMKTKYSLRKDYLSISVKANQKQRELVYTALAQLKEKSDFAIEDIINIEKRNIVSTATIIIIIDSIDRDLIRVINLLKKNNNIILITIGKSDKVLNGIKQFYINDKEAWDEIEKIQLFH